MLSSFQWWLLPLLTLVSVINVEASQVHFRDENGMNSAVFLSPKFVLGAGSVQDKFYYDINFPRGHIAIKEFNAEVVDEAGNSIPLHETYLHHWVVFRYYALRDGETSDGGVSKPKMIVVKNSGICQSTLRQYFGLGSETRKTDTYVPDPYGIEVGNPAEIPDGYEERWTLNVHAIDTRGVEDRLGCTECRCDLYNVTIDPYGRPLRPDYVGGLLCCYDETQCRLREGFASVKRSLYLRYTVKWVDWEAAIVPVKIYIFDVTDSGKRAEGSNSPVGFNVQRGCQVEFDVESCGVSGVIGDGCTYVKKTSIVIPTGGYVIYGGAHLHSAGISSSLYGEDGRTICSSTAIYGDGKDAGNEAGYIVGMSTCYPKPGSVKLSDGERLYLESNYSSTRRHTGVMGLFYILVADKTPEHALLLRTPIHEGLRLSKSSRAVIIMGAVITFTGAVVYQRRTKREEGYQSLVI